MKKTILALAAMSIVFASCVQNDPPPPPADDSPLKGKLFINEVNGWPSDDPNKNFELYNGTNEAISLEGFVVHYTEERETWRGRAADVIPAKGYKLIQGANAGYPGFNTGLSNRNPNVCLTLFDADGKMIDYYEKVPDLRGTPLEFMCHMRIPDGGKWYYVASDLATPGIANLATVPNGAIEMPAMEKGLKIEEITVSSVSPTPDDDVTITARITDVNLITSVVLKWKLNGADQPEKTMSKDGNLYSATISKQVDGAVVDWTVSASNDKDKTATESGTITWSVPKADYSKLVINEVNGVDKWFEIYNTGDVEINLEGVTAHYSNSEPVSWNATNTWTGTAAQTIPAKGYFSTKGATLGTGLSANNANVRLQLRAPDGTVLDTYVKLIDINTGKGFDHLTNKSHARIPDGTGSWYYTADGDGTSGATNGASTEGCVKFGEEDGSAPALDYSKLKFNEVSGVGDSDCDKFYELINLGGVDIPLKDCKIYYNANGSNGGTLPTGKGNLTWTGLDTQVASAGKLFSLIGRNGGNCTNPPTQGSFTTGLTAARILIITLEDPDGNRIDQCIRAKDTGDYAFTDKSFSRIPDGSGPFYFTTPTPDVTNGTSTEGLVLVPETP